MRTTYGIADLITLLAKLLAPFDEPLRGEFARLGVTRPAHGPASEPHAGKASADGDTAVEVIAAADSPAADRVSVVTPAGPKSVISIVMMESADATPDRVTATTPPAAEPLFTRRRSGGQWRYHVAQADADGERFRKLAGRRVRYEAVR